MKKITLVLTFLLSIISLNACSPFIVVGGVAGVGASVVVDRRDSDKIIEDEAIEIQATDYIYGNEEYGKKIHISVTSYNGTVLVAGEAPNEKSKNIILKYVDRLKNVVQVVDAVTIKQPVPFSERSNDTWLTTKVKSKLMANKGPVTHTKVVTSEGNVYLMGIVSETEAKEILKLANAVGGVSKVTALFEPYKNAKLSKDIAASTHTMQKQVKKQKEITELEEEDIIDVQPYTLPSPIHLSDDE